MLLSEFISKLEDLEMQEGNIPVFIDGERLFTIEVIVGIETGSKIVWIQQVEE